MTKLQAFFRLQNPVKTYAWGHRDQINKLIGRPDDGQPQAEVWMGAHPGSPSMVQPDGGGTADPVSLAELIRQQPTEFLGRFLLDQKIDSLPFLFKVLAAATPLSIQCHPSLAAAQAGFAREDAAGIPRDHERRNYKDANHKPEIICAVTEFWGLCGFRPVQAIREDFSALAGLSRDEAATAFFRLLATGPAPGQGGNDEAAWLCQLTARVLTKGEWSSPVFSELVRIAATQPEARFAHLFEASRHYPGDTGLLFFIILELIHLKPGQAQYIPAGVLHAYLRGFGVELMANSDNVLRGGLTPKHIDVAELLANLDPSATGTRFNPDTRQTVIRYPALASEFALTRLNGGGQTTRIDLPAAGVPQIALCMEGTARWTAASGENVELAQGQSLYIRPSAEELQVEFNGALYLASVPLTTDEDALFAGVDGGGTSTRVCLMDARGLVLGLGRAGPSSIDTVDAATTETSLGLAMAEAFRTFMDTPSPQVVQAWPEARRRALGKKAPPIRAIVAGIGGVDSPQDEAAVEGLLKRLPQVALEASCKAVNDMKTALAGGTLLQPGIVCILGTGSVAYGRNAAGDEHKTGGWGWKEGDPGSSFDLGISAIRILVRAGDGRASPSDFTRDLEKHLQLQNIAEITTWLYHRDIGRTEIAALAPIVSQWADRGDPHARAIVERAACETVEMIATVFHKLFGGGEGHVPLAIVGSLGNAPSWFRDQVLTGIAALSPRIEVRTDGLEPVYGAALWARQLCGLHTG